MLAELKTVVLIKVAKNWPSWVSEASACVGSITGSKGPETKCFLLKLVSLFLFWEMKYIPCRNCQETEDLVQVHIMARTAQISKEKRMSIITLRHEGQSIQNISRTLNISSSAVTKPIKHYDETGSHEDCHRKGRPRVTSAAEDKFIKSYQLQKLQPN